MTSESADDSPDATPYNASFQTPKLYGYPAEDHTDIYFFDPPPAPKRREKTERPLGISHCNLQPRRQAVSPRKTATSDEDPPGIQVVPEPEPILSKEQHDLVELIVSGRNVFYTGSAGCGKSTVLKAAVKRLRELGKSVRIVAPTGRAALQVNGTTTWSYMGWTPDYHKMTMEKLIGATYRKHVRRRIKNTDVLIVDEISMVENHHFERMNRCMKAALSKPNDRDLPPFGGVQIIVTGDFCQLPPVKPFEQCIECGRDTKPNDFGTEFHCPNSNHGPYREHDKWAFRSDAWEECNFVHVQLKEIHRQSDQKFIRMLQKCRLGIDLTSAETNILSDHPCQVNNATRLFSTRSEVQQVNLENFAKLKPPPVSYKTLDQFDWKKKEHPELGHYQDRLPDQSLIALKDHRIERHVELKLGMLVVLQVNLDLARGLCNGSQGIICGYETSDPRKFPRAKDTKSTGEDKPRPVDPVAPLLGGEHAELRERQIRKFAETQQPKVWPRVHFHNGLKRTIYADCVVNTVGDHEPYCLLHRTQIPLTAGWAMSIHKSQGMTLDRVIVNLTRAFEEGQVYVALSRATSLEGLKVEGDREGLTVGRGGNDEVHEFLKEQFGELLFNEDS